VQVQAVNDVGNLLFFVFLITTVILTAVLAYRKVRRRSIGKLSVAILSCLIAYAVTLVGVSLTSETRQLQLGTDKCFDDWCATITGIRLLPKAGEGSSSKVVVVTLRISNHARRAAFRPSQPRVTLVLSSGEMLSPSASAQSEFEKQSGPQENLAKRVVAGETFQTSLAFEVPSVTHEASVLLLEGPAAITRFLVGDEDSILHRKTVYPITFE
jgi:hypothetical protein